GEKNATGIYINYGEVLNDGTVKVNTAIPTKSKGAVGVYAENGAVVQNNGTIEVAGSDAIGIYGRPTRTGSKEFNGTDEGIITIKNNGTIDMTNANDSVGIFIDGTHSGSNYGLVADNYAENETNGIINTGKTTSAAGFASGMYGTFATLVNNGQINVNTGAAGFFASNSTEVGNIGNVDLADTSIALVMDKSSYDASIISTINVTTTAGSDVSSTTGKTGTILYLRSNSGSAFDNIVNNTVVTSAADNITHIIADQIILDNQATQTIGESGIALLAVNEAEITNNAQLDTTSAKAIGMAITEKGKIINDGTIDFSGSTSNQSIAMLGSYDSTLSPVPISGLELINTGDIKLAGANNAIGIYITSDTASAIDLTTNIDFVMNGSNTQQIGVYSIGENDIHLNAGGSSTSFAYDNNLNNILVFAKDGAIIDTSGAKITITGNNTAEGSSGERTIGIYLENAAVANEFDSTTTSLAVDGGAIGIYSKGGNKLILGAAGTTGLEVTGDKTVGAYIIGNDTISGGVEIAGTSGGNPVGIYNNGSVVTIDTNEFLVDITAGIGTGMYATNGGYFTGADITVQNASGDANIGVYYTKGTGSGNVAHDTNIIIDSLSTEMVGIYADGGINLSLNAGKAIEVEGTNSIGAMVNGTSTFTNSGSINQDTATGTIGVYVVDGTGINNTGSTIKVDSTDSMGMVAAGDAGKTSTIENKGTLTVEEGIGMVVGTPVPSVGNSVGKNIGTIDVNTSNATGVVIEKGAHNTFDGTGGIINVKDAAAAIYLDNTVSGQVICTGTLNLSNASATGIFADNGSIVDFDITMTGTAGIGLFADNGTIVSKTIDASGSTDTVAMYITDSGIHNGSSVTFVSGSKIITGTASTPGTTSAIGLLMNQMTYNLANIELIADGADSIASAIVDSTINSTAKMTLDNNAVGAYVDATSTLNFDGTMVLGDNTVGAYVDGGNATLGSTGAVVNFVGDDAVAMYAINGGSVTLGSNITSSGKGALAAAENGTMINTGTLTVENQAIGMVGLYDNTVIPGKYIENQATGDIKVKTGGIGMAAVLFTGSGIAPASSSVEVRNNGTMSVQDQDSVGMFATVGTVQNNGTLTVTNNGIGIYVKDDANIGNLGTINVTSGVGYVAEGINITGTGTINLNQGTAADYSIGGYYKDLIGETINVPSVTQADYSIVLAVDGGNGNTVSAITGGAAGGKNQIGAFAQNTDVIFTGITTIGDENIGAFVKNSTVNGTGTITTGISTASNDKSKSSVGMYMDNSVLNAGTDTVNAGDDTIGIYGKNSQMTIGNIIGGKGSVGIYAADGGKAEVLNGLTVAAGGLGAFGRNADVKITGNMNIGPDTAVGIVSQGTGDITYNGGVTTVDPQATSASIAIYKGTGRKTTTTAGVITETVAGIYTDGTITASGTMNIGDGGYAIYADNNAETFSTGTITVNNSADINLGMSSVGIYGGGSVVGTTTGSIKVGATYFHGGDHKDLENQLNSIGIYGENGAKLTNSGTITVHNPLSVGAYIIGHNSIFTNSASGVIDVDNGGVGVLTLGSTIDNYGTINTGYTKSTLEDVQSIGIAAYADGTNLATVNNHGTINVGEGTGVYLGGQSTLNNTGSILIDKGIGVFGDGTINNTGVIQVIAGGIGSTTADLNGNDVPTHGAITITDAGQVIVNNQYIHTSGTFVASDLVVNGSTVSIEGSLNGSQTEPYFVVDTIEGTIKLESNFIKTGNGYGWSVSNFVTLASAATPVDVIVTTSPLFVAHMTAAGGLEVAKQPYAYLVTGSQFDNLYNGIDSLLALDQEGTGNDSVLLKNLNAYLDGIYNSYSDPVEAQAAFNAEASRTLA
ncbi:beta strand repeat-containing protein, partial [Fusobacterium sp. PH5-44]|uniref:beta strand repeat-containing protein n=1 Tax=unclassified Fusobacterium TaxID=2648384 RepID=UPI003D221489